MNYIIEWQDGTVSIMALAHAEIDAAAEAAKVAENVGKQMVSMSLLTGTMPPREYREAWTAGQNGAVAIDMPRARGVFMAKVRKARDAALAKLDIETLKGIDVQDQKQVLRDLPQQLDLTTATTLTELEALWPTVLEV